MKNIILVISLVANIILVVFGIMQQREAERNLELALTNEKAAIEAAKTAEEMMELAKRERIKADSAAFVAMVQRDSTEYIRQRLQEKKSR